MVTLGGSQFYRYTNLSPKGSPAPEVVYALPTVSGTVIGACMLQGAGASFPGDCERIVGSLKLNPDNALGLGPNAEYASALTHLSDRLNLSVKQGEAALTKARKPGDQATAAKDLAGDYDQAAASVGKLPGNPRAAAATAALAKALRDQADAYRSLADYGLTQRPQGLRHRQGRRVDGLRPGGRGVQAAVEPGLRDRLRSAAAAARARRRRRHRHHRRRSAAAGRAAAGPAGSNCWSCSSCSG